MLYPEPTHFPCNRPPANIAGRLAVCLGLGALCLAACWFLGLAAQPWDLVGTERFIWLSIGTVAAITLFATAAFACGLKGLNNTSKGQTGAAPSIIGFLLGLVLGIPAWLIMFLITLSMLGVEWFNVCG